jgi:rusticyanin
MGRFDQIPGTSMMGEGGTMGGSGYTWMMGGASVAPQWMQGLQLHGSMMGSSTDMGRVMGRLFADAPGPRVSAPAALALGSHAPPRTTVDEGANRITFNGDQVALTVLASPPRGPDETFRVAGLVNPTVVVQSGAQVALTLVNADNDTAHGLVVTSPTGSSSSMPMMNASEAFKGAAVWFLGNPTAAGFHEGTMTFTADTPGTYRYLCPVPGHADKGMAGTFVVRS